MFFNIFRMTFRVFLSFLGIFRGFLSFLEAFWGFSSAEISGNQASFGLDHPKVLSKVSSKGLVLLYIYIYIYMAASHLFFDLGQAPRNEGQTQPEPARNRPGTSPEPARKPARIPAGFRPDSGRIPAGFRPARYPSYYGLGSWSWRPQEANFRKLLFNFFNFSPTCKRYF